MTIHGLFFRFFGWAFAIALISGEFTFYDDGHSDAWTKGTGVAVLLLWGSWAIRWFRQAFLKPDVIQ